MNSHHILMTFTRICNVKTQYLFEKFKWIYLHICVLIWKLNNYQYPREIIWAEMSRALRIWYQLFICLHELFFLIISFLFIIPWHLHYYGWQMLPRWVSLQLVVTLHNSTSGTVSLTLHGIFEPTLHISVTKVFAHAVLSFILIRAEDFWRW